MLLQTNLFIAFLIASAIYLIMDTRFIYVIFGFALLSSAVCLLIVAFSTDPQGKLAPLVNQVQEGGGGFVDPLPQALVLTAIVIGLGMLSFLITLSFRLASYYKTGFLNSSTIDREEW